jgi:hypothetical protein
MNNAVEKYERKARRIGKEDNFFYHLQACIIQETIASHKADFFLISSV